MSEIHNRQSAIGNARVVEATTAEKVAAIRQLFLAYAQSLGFAFVPRRRCFALTKIVLARRFYSGYYARTPEKPR